jgi:hypothetical protein
MSGTLKIIVLQEDDSTMQNIMQLVAEGKLIIAPAAGAA